MKPFRYDRRPRHIDLFTGVGGFHLAAAGCGFETVVFAETDPFCAWYLERNYPGIRNCGDVRAATGERGDLVTGGFPCQPFSRSGKRRGTGDDRALWPFMRGVVAASGARWVLAENVPGIIEMELDQVLADLEALGYTAGALTVPAAAADAPHLRERVWILAEDERRRGAGAFCQGVWEGNEGVFSDADGESGQCPGAVGAMARTAGKASGEMGILSWHPAGSAGEDHEPGGLWWPDEPGMARMADGIPSGGLHAAKALGNAIVPAVAAEILRGLVRSYMI